MQLSWLFQPEDSSHYSQIWPCSYLSYISHDLTAIRVELASSTIIRAFSVSLALQAGDFNYPQPTLGHTTSTARNFLRAEDLSYPQSLLSYTASAVKRFLLSQSIWL